ncbi:MAG: HD domain-containing protein, partial [Desulfotignum balticum]|nr:HD domain-containing protein [Desulfotignum balticum]
FYFPRALRRVPWIAACHHEKIDGTGYPRGLTEDQIPLESKIIAVSDVFDALTSLRDYPKYAFGKILDYKIVPIEKTVYILKKDVGSHFDPDVIEAFLSCLPEITFDTDNAR